MVAYAIEIHFEFEGGVRTGRPFVTNSTTQTDAIEERFTAITWKVVADQRSDDLDGLKITGIEFFRDPAKTQQVHPDVLELPGGRNPDGQHPADWWINFRDVDLLATDRLQYTILFEDDNFPNQSWDPTLEIKPRHKGPPDESASRS